MGLCVKEDFGISFSMNLIRIHASVVFNYYSELILLKTIHTVNAASNAFKIIFSIIFKIINRQSFLNQSNILFCS